jgi:hypothetical protein
MKTIFIGSAFACMLAIGPALAQTGPVATQCAHDIAAYCSGKGHGSRQTRSCLEAHRDQVSTKCRRALDSTGAGRGK